MMVLMNTGGVAMTNCFLIADETAGQAVIFDAPDNTTGPLLNEVVKRGWQLAGLWLTHGHFDHFADHGAVRRQFPNAKVLIHPLDEPKTRNPGAQTRLFGLSFEIQPLSVDAHLADNQVLSLGSLKVRVMHTPGHSPGHVSFYFPEESVLVGGDLIIGGSVGRTDLPDSNHGELEASIRRVMELPPATRLLGGHGPVTLLGDEASNNPFVRVALQNR